MAASDLSVLLDMGFEQERAEMAVKKTGGLQGAIEWLETIQDKSLEEVKAAEASTSTTDANDETGALQPGEEAKSMVCDDCGKKFRSIRQAEVHAERTQHENFSESTEEIAPLTEEEKKAKLEELRANLAEKRAKQAIIDKEEAKKNEKIRMKSTKEVADLKEQLAHKELQKAAAAKKAEKAADIAAKKRIQEKIAADKEARRLKAEEAKALREGRAAPESSAPAAPAPSTSATTASKPAANHTEARLRLQTAGGTVTKTFPAETTLLEVAMSVQAENGGAEVRSLTMTFPKKTWEGDVDFGLTLKEAGLMPSAVLIVK